MDLEHDARQSSDRRVGRTKRTVLSAAAEVLALKGYSGFSVEAIVERTGVAKTTLYRHWPNRTALLRDVIASLGGETEVPDTGSVRGDLLALFAARAEAAKSPQWEQCMPALVEAAARDPELARTVGTVTAELLADVERVLSRGIARGEVAADVDPGAAASLLIGPIVFRRLLLQESPDQNTLVSFINLGLAGIGGR